MNKIVSIIFPSQNTDLLSIQNILRWSNRLYSLYSLSLFFLIQWFLDKNFNTKGNLFLALFVFQACILMYIFQSYRRYFFLSKAIKLKWALLLSGIWLIVFFLYNVSQIIFSPLYALSMDSQYVLLRNIIPVGLVLLGEYLFRKNNVRII
jgi:hypothetical protein